MPRKKAKTSKPFIAAEPVVGYVTNPGKKSLIPLTDDDWAIPGRPATDEEHLKMLAEAEAEYKAGLGMTVEEARAKTKKKIAAWKKANLK